MCMSKNACRAKNKSTCRVHGEPSTVAAINSRNPEAYFAARAAEEAEKKAKDLEQRAHVTKYIDDQLTMSEWGAYGTKVRKLITHLTRAHGTPLIGRTRAVFDMGNGYMMKVPFNDEGEYANGNEVRASAAEDPMIPVAECFYNKVEDVDVIMMEKVDRITVDFARMPAWVGYVDCGQVGLNRKGDLVAYDL